MTAKECIVGRRSIRRFTDKPIEHALLEEIIETASFAPSWKNTQITRYTAVEGAMKDKLAQQCTSVYAGNAAHINSAPMVIAVSIVKGRCGYEKDGSFSTVKGDGWQMFDAGIASEAFCLAAYEKGLGTVILGLFDVAEAAALLEIPAEQELVALIPIGYPAETPAAPKRKTVSDLLSYK
ncbi:MAG: nitroreductase family protein [Roseburia sp.]|nr:nitroreductase family protein [Roseburia sp.]